MDVEVTDRADSGPETASSGPVVLEDQRFADRHACTAGGLNDSAELLGSGRVGGGLLGGDASALAAAGVRRAAGRGEGGGEGDGYGNVLAGGEFRWIPRWSWTRLRALPTDLRYIRAREMTFREMLWLPDRVLVIECESSVGPVRLWAHLEQAVQVVEMIRRASSPNSSKTPVPDVSS
ncbi:hypothetical protein [Streptomyces sp. NPDC057696]|uniref:hypothetical protein n=1 Tax=Streptomyces sp. NPDC057696 TaxID=3346218 RepID=UPI0036C0A8CF